MPNTNTHGVFDSYGAGAQAHAWFIWEKGYKDEPTISWTN